MVEGRLKKVILYVVCTLDELVNEGLLERGPGPRISSCPRGVSKFDQIKASGFRPTAEELDAVLPKLTGDAPRVAALVKKRIADERRPA
jgi:hypothetical protein